MCVSVFISSGEIRCWPWRHSLQYAVIFVFDTFAQFRGNVLFDVFFIIESRILNKQQALIFKDNFFSLN